MNTHSLKARSVPGRFRALRFEALEERRLLASVAPPLFFPNSPQEVLLADKLGVELAALYFDWSIFSESTGSISPSFERFDDFLVSVGRTSAPTSNNGILALDVVAVDSAVAIQDALEAIGFDKVDSIGRVISSL